jgi:hypothetical protein
MITNHDLKHESTELARLLGSSQTLTGDLRTRVIALRTKLVERGLYDPVLGRLDSATVAQSSVTEVAQQFEKIAATFD